jgi:hypothetical protein
MMGDIYEKCTLCFIWLGDRFSQGFDDNFRGHPYTIDDMPTLPWNADEAMKHGESNFDELITGMGEIWAAFMMIYTLSKGKHIYEYSWASPGVEADGGFGALRAFIMLRWWSRAWVIQETVLPPQAIVVWSSFQAPWAMFAAAARNFNRHVNTCCITSWIHMPNGLHKTILSLFAGIVSEFDRVDRKRHGRLAKAIAEALFLTDSAGGEAGGDLTGSGTSAHLNELRLEALRRAPLTQKGFLWEDQELSTDILERPLSTLTELLWAFRNREATNPRDKVYALRSLVSDWHNGHALIPDYRLSVRGVWAQTLEESLSRNDLTILTGKRSRTPDLPSWIPDWNQWTDGGNTINTIDIETAEQQHKMYDYYHASRDKVINDYYLEDATLALSGIHVDEITTISQVQFARIRKHRTTVSTLQQWQAIIDHPNQKDNAYANTSTTRDDAFWRTMVRDVYLNEKETRRASPSDYLLFNQYFEMIAFERLVSETLDWPKAEKVMATVHTATYNHRFFVTEKGYFGLGNPDTQVGDQVWVLIGGKVPFVLRPVVDNDGMSSFDNSFRLIGDCYLHGIMDGEAVANNDDGDESNEQYVFLL